MNTISWTRTDLLRLLLATALVMMSVSTVGALLGLAAWPAMQIIQERANFLVSAAAALVNAGSIGVVIWGLHVARSRAGARPASVWARNLALLNIASFVALVYLAGVIVSFVGHEARSFVEIPFGNATQVDMFSPAARFCFEVLFPAVGVVILLVVGPRFLQHVR